MFRPIATFLLSLLVVCALSQSNNCIEELLGGPQWQSPLSQYVSSDFNIISFGNFNGTTGDVEGRLAVLGSVSLGDGFSIGYQIQTEGVNATDNVRPFSLVVGGDLTWISGALFPEGNGDPYPGPEEGIYAGSSHNSLPADLASRIEGGPCNGCLKPSFALAYSYFMNVSETFASATPNAQITLQNGGLFVSSQDSRATRYYAQIDTDTFNQGTFWSNTNVNVAAQFIITLTGDSDPSFQGGGFIGITERVVFNVPGKKTINVVDGVYGNLLAPQSTLSQTGGDEKGMVIIGDVVKFVEAQKPICPLAYCCKWCTPNSTSTSTTSSSSSAILLF